MDNLLDFLKRLFSLILLISLVTTISCNEPEEEVEKEEEKEEEPTPVNPSEKPNILLIIADDMGLDATNSYPEGDTKPNTFHIDSLMNAGLKFNNVWVNPTCTPTRASIITGKYGTNSSVLEVGDELPASEQILQAYINEQTNTEYSTAIVGKWHLSGRNSFNPETLGIDYYAGLLTGGANSYTSWDFTEDGNTTTETTYITEKFTDLSIDWVNGQEKPWFLWLAYTAPHTPFHVPPAEMHSQGSLPDDNTSINANPLPYYLAAIEAMDYQIGRLLDNLSSEELANTVIIFVGDNGTPGSVAQSPYSRTKAKGSIYQGGINVPMFVTGKNVSRSGSDNALINGTDLFATIADIAIGDISEVNDSKSFLDLTIAENTSFRETIYSEQTPDAWCIRNNTYKFLEFEDGSQEFYNLITDPYETNNLLNGTLSSTESSAFSSLKSKAEDIRN